MSNLRWLLLALVAGCAVVAGCSAKGDNPGDRTKILPILPAPPPPPAPPVIVGPGAPPPMPRAGMDAPPPTPGKDAGEPDSGPEDDIDLDAGFAESCAAGQFCPGPKRGCGTLRFDTDVEVSASGNLLIVFDQSNSMRGAWQMTTKLEAARAALVSAITPLQGELKVGALFLPTRACLPRTPMGGAVAPIEDASQIDFRPGVEFLQAFAEHWAMLGNTAAQGTPLNEAFDRADIALQAVTKLGVKGKLGVVVFTDGEPNCAPNATVTGVPTAGMPERAAQWAMQGISTYVVGLPGANGVQILDNIAMSGGTMGYITPNDPAQLATTLKQVVEEQVTRTFASCSMKLNPAAEFPDQLRLFVTRAGKREEPERMGMDGSGWSVSSDGKKAKLTGQLCKDAEAGLFDSVTFEYGCYRKPPPPPPPPPMSPG